MNIKNKKEILKKIILNIYNFKIINLFLLYNIILAKVFYLKFFFYY